MGKCFRGVRGSVGVAPPSILYDNSKAKAHPQLAKPGED